MMAAMMGFDVLPALNEGDERICLADILMLRDSCLRDEELWAVCMETCVGIQDVNSSEMFQTLCITPESLAFDSSGATCFLDLATDPELMYIPPEYESVGNSYKAHLYSLGMTLLFAAEYNAGESDSEQVGMGEELSALVSRMTADDYDERVSLPEVMRLCEKNLGGKCSQRLCMELASIAKLDDGETSSTDSSDSSTTSVEDSPESSSVEEGPPEESVAMATKAPLTTATVIDLQNTLTKGITTMTTGDDTSTADETGSPVISPPAAFRNSAADYRRAVSASPVLPSPPKVSRMMALLDNGEIRATDAAVLSGSGSGSEGARTPTTPTPAFELGVSENSAFQVVWSPRSSKPTSPSPGGETSSGETESQQAGRIPTIVSASGTLPPLDVNVVSTTVEEVKVTPIKVSGESSVSRTDTELRSVKNKLDELMAKYSQKLSPRSPDHASSHFRMAAQARRALPFSYRPSHRESTLEEEEEGEDGQEEDGVEGEGEAAGEVGEEEGVEDSRKEEQVKPSLAKRLHQKMLDFEFGPSISPVPTFAKRQDSTTKDEDSTDGESEPEVDDRLPEVAADDDDDDEMDETPRPTTKKLRVSLVKMEDSSEEEDEEGEESGKDDRKENEEEEEEEEEEREFKFERRFRARRGGGRRGGGGGGGVVSITAGHLRRLGQSKDEQHPLGKVMEEHEEEEEEEEKSVGSSHRLHSKEEEEESAISSEDESQRSESDVTAESSDSDRTSLVTDDSTSEVVEEEEEGERGRPGWEEDAGPQPQGNVVGVRRPLLYGLGTDDPPEDSVRSEACRPAGSNTTATRSRGDGVVLLHGLGGGGGGGGGGAGGALGDEPGMGTDAVNHDDRDAASPAPRRHAHLEEGSTVAGRGVGGSGGSEAWSASGGAGGEGEGPTLTEQQRPSQTQEVTAAAAAADNSSRLPGSSASTTPAAIAITSTKNNNKSSSTRLGPTQLTGGTSNPLEEEQEEKEQEKEEEQGEFGGAFQDGSRNNYVGRDGYPEGMSTSGERQDSDSDASSEGGVHQQRVDDSDDDDDREGGDGGDSAGSPSSQSDISRPSSATDVVVSGRADDTDDNEEELQRETIDHDDDRTDASSTYSETESGSSSEEDPETDDDSPGCSDSESAGEDKEEEKEEVETSSHVEDAESKVAVGHHVVQEVNDGGSAEGDEVDGGVKERESEEKVEEEVEKKDIAHVTNTPPTTTSTAAEGTTTTTTDTGDKEDAGNTPSTTSDDRSAAPEGAAATSTTGAEKDEGDMMSSSSSRGAAVRGPMGSAGKKSKVYGEPDRQTQTVQEMLEKLGCGLHENELWALCKECTRALARYKYDLPAYISLETVFIEEGGEAGYQSVADDRELEVVYLAPELQQHGVVTEKTCLFGIAAMLWSAADYKLPPNQEPALSEQLESLLISMTQDNHELRPQVSDVLQICSDYDRRNEVNSTLVCQALYSDAQKAEAFGKDNALVRDILGDDMKKQQASRQAQLLSCIKVAAELQSQLKPVSERQLAEKPVVRTLHDKLMDEISNPPKKLRKSSKPKVMNVRSIFLNNPDLMADLQRVTGGSQHNMAENSAFVATSAYGAAPTMHPRNLIAQPPPQQQQHQYPLPVPSAYQSAATHFSPIVVSPSNGPLPVNKPVLATTTTNETEKDRQVARKMRELKKNLLKKRTSTSTTTMNSMAHEVERDAALTDRSTLPQHPQMALNGQAQLPGAPPGGMAPPGAPPGAPPPGSAGAGLFPFQVQLQHDPRTGLFQLIPVAVQQEQQQQQQQQQQHQQQQHQQQQQQQAPAQAYGSTALPAGGGQPNHVSPPSGPASSAAAATSATEARERASQIQRESEERRRYLRHTEEELRARVKVDGVDHQRSRSSGSIGSRSSDKSRSEHKVKSRSGREHKDGHHHQKSRSHTVSSSDLRDNLARATNNVRVRAKEETAEGGRSSSSGRLKKSSSEENILDKVERSGRSRAHRSEENRARLKRAKSGSSLDYRAHLEVKDARTEEGGEVHPNHSHHHHHHHSHQNHRHRRDRTGGAPSGSGSNHHHHHHLSKSQPHLDLELPQDDVRRPRDATRRSRPAPTNLTSTVTATSHHDAMGTAGESAAGGSGGGGGAAVVASSPPPSPSLSKDSGVSGLNLKSSGGSGGELTLMERLLNSDTIRHQQRLSKVICLLRDEFAFDGYMENGVEDFAMAEYILSLANLKWETFNNAITEKYCDLFWQDELLTGLFEAVNGTRPVIEKRVPANGKMASQRQVAPQEASAGVQHRAPGGHHQHQQHQQPGRTRPGSPKPAGVSLKKTALPPGSMVGGGGPHSSGQAWNGKDLRMTHDTITGSAFRPIRAVHPVDGGPAVSISSGSTAGTGSTIGGTGSQLPDGPVYKPMAVKAAGSSQTDTSDSTDTERTHRPRRYRKKSTAAAAAAAGGSTGLDKSKSSSMHDLYAENQEREDNNNHISKSHSQGDLIDDEPQPQQQHYHDPHQTAPAARGQQQQQRGRMGIAVSLDGSKPKVVYIRSSESENDSYDSNTNVTSYANHDDGMNHHPHHHHPHPRVQHHRQPGGALNGPTGAGGRLSNSYAYRYDSDSSSTSDRRPDHQLTNNTMPYFHRQGAQQRTAAASGAPALQRALSRDDAQSESSRGSSGGGGGGRRLTSARSESYLNMLSSSDEFGSRERVFGGPGGGSVTSGSSFRRMFRGSVIYYPAEMEHYLRPEIKEFAVQVWNRRKTLVQDTRTKENIEAKMATMDQEMMVEYRQKRKTLRFYQKLAEANRAGKGGDQKGMMSKMSKQLMEMNTKLEFLDSAKKHLEMLYAEQWGLDHYLLHSLAECPPDEPMLLSASENPSLQYQAVKGGPSQTEGHILQAGLPDGLMAYLFAQNALSEGYIHQFFYCFRYLVTPAELLDFLMVKFTAASLSLSPEADVPTKVKARAVDLLQVWIEGYYSIDFKHNHELTNILYDFIKDKIVPLEPNAEYLLELLEDAQDDRHVDLYYPQFCVADDLELQLIQAEAPPKKDDKKQHKEWESFKAALHLSAKPQKLRQPLRTRVMSMSSERYLGQQEIDKCDNDAYFPRSTIGRLTDTFELSDYTSQTLAEQLSLVEQDLFRQSHPVHYLNSKAQGVGVALTTPAINKAQSMYRLTAAWEDNQESSLFVGTFTTDDIIQRMIEHSQAISFWVAAEIVCCDTSKAQVAAISKFLTTARICQEMRNFATCISILDGLENVLVRQVPAWRNLPSKYVTIMDELASVRVFLKSDNLCLLETDVSRSLPTIPCILLFLLHVQQLEIGGFRLVNNMYKWTKMKAISKVIDQIRIFKEHTFNYEPDYELQEMIRQRMRDLGQQDLHVLAAQHDNNFQKVASRMPTIFKKMKGRMAKSGEA